MHCSTTDTTEIITKYGFSFTLKILLHDYGTLKMNRLSLKTTFPHTMLMYKFTPMNVVLF